MPTGAACPLSAQFPPPPTACPAVTVPVAVSVATREGAATRGGGGIRGHGPLGLAPGARGGGRGWWGVAHGPRAPGGHLLFHRPGGSAVRADAAPGGSPAPGATDRRSQHKWGRFRRATVPPAAVWIPHFLFPFGVSAPVPSHCASSCPASPPRHPVLPDRFATQPKIVNPFQWF